MNPLPLAFSFAGDFKDFAKSTESIEENYNKFIDKESPTKTIREIRSDFQELLQESQVKNLIVIIDDLDRCSPDRIVETLEAVKLFLSVEKTTFIFAVDEDNIRYSIRAKYPIYNNDQLDISKDYIEKIIQIPIVIPELSSKDIQNYLVLLYVQNKIKNIDFEIFLKDIYDKKILVSDQALEEEYITEFIKSKKLLGKNEFDVFSKELKIIDSIKGIVCSSLKGNPRQAKRFLNAFFIKKELSNLYFGNEIDSNILAKLMALYVVSPKAFGILNNWNAQYTGEITELKNLVECNDKKVPFPIDSEWNDPKVKKWIESEPKDIYKYDLSKYFYLTKSYLTKTTPLHTSAKRGLTSYIKNPSQWHLQNAVSKFAESTQSEGTQSTKLYARSVSSIFRFVNDIKSFGYINALSRNDFSETFADVPELFNAVLEKENIFGLDRDILNIALTKTIEELELTEIDTLTDFNFDDFLVVMIINLISACFENRYYEHILQKVNNVERANKICNEIKDYITNSVIAKLTSDLGNLHTYTESQIASIIEKKCNEAYAILALEGEE